MSLRLSSPSSHTYDLHCRIPEELFGTPLPDVTKHEGIDSFHGADPKGTVHVPEFLDHCITALMQMGACSFFFRRSQAGQG